MVPNVGMDCIGYFCYGNVTLFFLAFIYFLLFRSGVETLPHNAKAHYNYANFLKDVGRDKEAIIHYGTALK